MSDDSVHIIDIRNDGLMVAKYGRDSKRSEHVCCPRCTNETQIYPMLHAGEALVCSECGYAVSMKKEKPSFFLFSANGGKLHIALSQSTPPTAITGRQFNVSDVEYCNEMGELCTFCEKKYVKDYGSIDPSRLETA